MSVQQGQDMQLAKQSDRHAEDGVACWGNNRVLLLGQFISLLITCTGVFTQILNQSYQIQIPAAQSAGNYLLCSLYLIHPLLAWIRDRNQELEIPLWKYFLLALADVEGNYLVVSAYKYTSISSAMLLDCFTIPMVMLLSSIFLDAKYTRCHFVAVAFCLGGISVLVVSDIMQDGSSMMGWNTSALYGDFLCLLGSAIYACSNVGQEYLVKKKNRRLEFLGMVGICGFTISSIQCYIFEGEIIREIKWSTSSALCLAGYVVTLFLMYTFTSIFMKTGDAAMFNLSLLTSDFFAVLAARFLFDQTLSNLYFVGFCLIIAGIVIYNQAPPPTTAPTHIVLEDPEHLQLLPTHHM